MRRQSPGFDHALRAALLLCWAASAQGGGTIACQDGSPAVPLERFRTIPAQGTFDLWPAGLQPADPVGQPLPPNRDSTAYTGSQRPGRGSGLEFFYALDIVAGASGTHLLTAYNAGFQVWDIGGAQAAAPQLLAQVDGWDGEFFAFEPLISDAYIHVRDIAALNPASSEATLAALAADTATVGLSIWDLSVKSSPVQLYQDLSGTGIQVVAAEISGRVYAFLAAADGIQVYDLTRAREAGPCQEETATAAMLCGGNADPVWRGRLEPWAWGRARHLSPMQTTIDTESRTFLAVSDADPNNGLGIEILEIEDPAARPPTGRAIIEGLDSNTMGVALFALGGGYRLGTTDAAKLEVRDVSACITGAPGCALSGVEASFDTALTQNATLEYSEGDGRPFLYRGFESGCSGPPASTESPYEYLLDLSGLAAGGAALDVRGQSYLDPNHAAPQRTVDYWSSYYDGTTDGFGTFAPYAGKFHGPYFYRASQTVFDIHVLTDPLPPGIFADGFEAIAP